MNTNAQISEAILASFTHSPLLIGNLPEATCFDPTSLTTLVESPALNFQQKLGHLYEDALALIIASSPRFDLLERNLQIQKDIHSTLGELDFLIRDLTSGQLIHLELATKFYLSVGSELPGPDARDNYFKKLTRLRDHQLQLPRSFQAHLPVSYRNETIATQQLIYGCLFDHIKTTSPASPKFINPNCRHGKWLRLSELPHHFPNDQKFHLIPKPLWPVPLNLLSDLVLETWIPSQQLEHCTMASIPGDQTPYFIAPDSYPDTTR